MSYINFDESKSMSIEENAMLKRRKVCLKIYFSEVTSAEKKIKMVVSKHLTHFYYPIRLVLH